MNVNEIAARVKSGQAITDAEKAYLLRNNAHALFAFMIDNNPGSVNLALRKQGYTHLGFAPDKKALMRQLDLMIERNDAPGLDKVMRAFNLIPDYLTPEFIQEFHNQFYK